MANDPNIHPVPGIPIPPDNWVWIQVGPLTWGCRAILDERGKKPYLDILWDRQGWAGAVEDQAARSKLGKMINSVLPKLRAMVARGEVPGTGREGEVVIRKVKFKYYARGGYLWVAAGEVNK